MVSFTRSNFNKRNKEIVQEEYIFGGDCILCLKNEDEKEIFYKDFLFSICDECFQKLTKAGVVDPITFEIKSKEFGKHFILMKKLLEMEIQ